MNLINIRKVGYGVRKLEDITKGIQHSQENEPDLKEQLENLLEQLLNK